MKGEKKTGLEEVVNLWDKDLRRWPIPLTPSPQRAESLKTNSISRASPVLDQVERQSHHA